MRYSRLSRFFRNFDMNSSELVTIVAEAHDISKAQVQAILERFEKHRQGRGERRRSFLSWIWKVQNQGFARTRGPPNGEKIKIAASKKLSFSPAKAVKDVLNA